MFDSDKSLSQWATRYSQLSQPQPCDICRECLRQWFFFFFWFSKSTSLHINVWICFIWKIVTFYDLQYIKTNIKYNAFSLLFIDVFNTLYLSLCYRAIAFCFFFVLSSISWDACHRYSTNLSSSSPKIYKIHSTCWSPSSIIQIIGNL